MKYSGATDQGRSRTNNEDAWVVEESLSAAILADGMGGASCGEVASAVTVAAIVEYLRHPEQGLSPAELTKEAIREANQRVIETALGREDCSGMGSTVVLALWRDAEMVIANVGDSRAYLYRAGELRQVSYDQNFANELRSTLGFSEERVLAMPNRHVLTMAVGAFDHVLVRTHVQHLEPGDQVLMCSDGLHGPVEHATIASILSGPESLAGKVDRLIAHANARGGPDNVTVVLLEYGND